ncbi:MAG: BON domain-containing protein [Phormidesmis sp.]
MGVIGESSVVLIPAVDKLFGSVVSASYINGFRHSPPERIGVMGEYDYNGLAKRVMHSFQQAFGDEVSRLKVRQRGCVVILTGVVASRSLLNHLVSLANRVEGAALVELYRVTFTEDDIAA